VHRYSRKLLFVSVRF